MTKPTTLEGLYLRELRKINQLVERAFEPLPGCSEGDSAINDVALDQSTEITRAVAEVIQCPEWMPTLSQCDTPDMCFCKNAAERVAKIVGR